MSLGKIVKTNGKFEFVELSEDEQYAAISESISKNIALFDKVRRVVQDYLWNNELHCWFNEQADITIAIFNAIAIKGFTALDTALAKKINDIKENGSK